MLTQPLFATVLVNDASVFPASVIFGNDFLGHCAFKLTQSIPSGQGAFFVTFDDLGRGDFGFGLPRNTYSIAEENRFYLAPIGTPV